MYSLAKKFVYGKADIDTLAQEAELPRSTFYSRMRRYLAKLPDISEDEQRDNTGDCVVMGIDTTYFKDHKESRPYLLVINNLTGGIIYRKLLEKEDGKTIKTHIIRLRDQFQCNPKVITCDLGRSILYAIKEVFPTSTIEGCWFHEYRRLDNKLPTMNQKNGVFDDTRALWRQVKRQILKALVAVDAERRHELLKELGNISLEKDASARAKNTIAAFKKNCELGYYQTQDILRNLVGTQELDRVVYNNMPESRFKEPKARSKKAKLWIAVYDNTYYFFKRDDRRAQIKSEVAPQPTKTEEGDIKWHLPLQFFLDSPVAATEFDTTGIPSDQVLDEVKKCHATLADGIIIGKPFLSRVQRYIKRKTAKNQCVTPEDLQKVFRISPAVAQETARLVGLNGAPAKDEEKTEATGAESMQSHEDDLFCSNTMPVPGEGVIVSEEKPPEREVLLASRLPSGLDAADLTLVTAIASTLYLAPRGLTSSQITRQLSTEWRSVDVRNVSRELTMKTAKLRPYVTRDNATRQFRLTEEGRNWFEQFVLARSGASVT